MEFYTKEIKQELLHEVELGLSNIKRCMSFVVGQEGDKADYELGKCSNEFLVLRDVKEDLEFSINKDEVIYIAEVDYFLVKRWSRFSIESYKTHFLNRKEYQWCHG